jgi:hypothetical protein
MMNEPAARAGLFVSWRCYAPPGSYPLADEERWRPFHLGRNPVHPQIHPGFEARANAGLLKNSQQLPGRCPSEAYDRL